MNDLQCQPSCKLISVGCNWFRLLVACQRIEHFLTESTSNDFTYSSQGSMQYYGKVKQGKTNKIIHY
jgi:hypothetical protein